MTSTDQGADARTPLWRVALPCSLTLGCVVAGFAAIALTGQGRIAAAVWLLYAAVILDMLDGWVARAVQGTSQIGKELDSLADIVAFGVAPAFVVLRSALGELGSAALVAPTLYVLAGAVRLARYNIAADAHQRGSRIRGLPITVAAGYMMLLGLLGPNVPAVAAAISILLLVAAMLSTWPLPTLAVGPLLRAMILLSLGLFTLSVAWPSVWTILGWNVWNMGILLVARQQRSAS